MPMGVVCVFDGTLFGIVLKETEGNIMSAYLSFIWGGITLF